ncbi:hypothetical protein POM88_026026 [Heracleum sosnowskyi]|uniref:Uncharacterized protein n=1 Tax=Heracleum sosnowskyi TaxID=360622 RepID=A0AAD8I509_9APIA|nr:hypothetical protein POM88_026026 [Heracleum sosnowskyi]
MATSSFMNKQTVISGVTFATNNFVVVLDHQELPNEFHVIQDFLTSSSLKYALTEPVSVSFKSVMQVWNTTVFGKGPTGNVLMQFEFNGATHHVTPAVIEEALHLPILGDKVPDIVSDSTIFEFVTKLGSLKIGYSLIYSLVFYYGTFILKALSDRKSDKLGSVCFLRFLQLIFNHLCPNATFEEDVILPICRITENNIKSLVNNDEANGFTGNAFFPDEVRLFLKEKMPTCYGSVSDATGQGQSHLVPDTSIPPKHSKHSTITSTVSQKTVVVKSKKSARSDVSGRQSGSKDFSSTPLTKQKKQGGVQGVLVKIADKVEEVYVKRKLVLRDETASEDDMLISSKFKMHKEVVDIASDDDISIPDEQSNPDPQANPDVGSPDATPSTIVSISDSPAKASPTSRIVEISWEKVGADASKLGFTHPMEKKRKAEEKVFKRQKKLKGSSPQEPEPQCGSAATEDPATQEPVTQSVSEGTAEGMVTQEPFSQRENEDIHIPAPQEPSSQSKDAGKSATVSKEFPDNAQGTSTIPEMKILAPQEPLVANIDACQSNPDSVAPNASGAPNVEPILIQPLSSRPMKAPVTDHQDKLKGIILPDPTDNDDSDDSDDDYDDDEDIEKDQLVTAIKSSLGTNFGSSSTFMAGKASIGKDSIQDFSSPSAIDPAEQLRRHEWENEWYMSDDPVSYPCALDHASYAASLIENEDVKNHLKATTLLSKSLKDEIDSLKAATELMRTDISNSLTKAPTAFQLRVVESHVKSLITEQSHINTRIDSLDSKVTDIQASLSLILNLLSTTDAKKGEKLSQTNCTPDLVLRKNNDDDHTGHDGDDMVLQGGTSDAAMVKSTIQTSQSQSMQSTHVSDSGVRIVRTLVKSQILTEEQILTGDQILMADQILTPGHGQTLSTIPEGNEDVLIENPEDAANLFQKFKTKDGDVVTLYHTDKRVQQLFARKALSISTE